MEAKKHFYEVTHAEWNKSAKIQELSKLMSVQGRYLTGHLLKGTEW